MLILALMVSVSGCKSGESVIDTYCEKYYPLPFTNDVEDDFMKIGEDLQEYIEVNEDIYFEECQ
jgi:hypothetical protein